MKTVLHETIHRRREYALALALFADLRLAQLAVTANIHSAHSRTCFTLARLPKIRWMRTKNIGT